MPTLVNPQFTISISKRRANRKGFTKSEVPFFYFFSIIVDIKFNIC